MQKTPSHTDISTLDFEAIERQARILRARAIRSWFLSLKARFSGRDQSFAGRSVQA